MAAYSKYLAGLTLEDRTALEGRLLERQSGKCFICDDTIDPVLHQDQLDVDHIVPLAEQGADDEQNFALVAESLVAVAKSVDIFRVEVESLHTRWKEIKGGPQGTAKVPRTPLWEYYQPILQALVDLGGAAKSLRLSSAVELLLKDRFVEGDLSIMANGSARWQVMIRRARKHMVKEGLLDSDTGMDWKITQQGRKAAAARKNAKD